jgi:hypothetical protein
MHMVIKVDTVFTFLTIEMITQLTIILNIIMIIVAILIYYLVSITLVEFLLKMSY